MVGIFHFQFGRERRRYFKATSYLSEGLFAGEPDRLQAGPEILHRVKHSVSSLFTGG
jgi:hypothetical protein